ncbi:hypothetical protein PR003_g21760 [Phytophthora rubi]|uniref:Myb/SANT-like DNA-binding domain-containing protein n=1 Tax=Phytophthora rubi TaxID=129364 RepID=A0A6A3JFH1_9STRA|nr:hypothetical protein PR001_g20808 [Phytophthora rubi]KAE8998235.1 hypothetical protein PR002_g18790 [Phytophthora rubi]KAE9304373.1 hypothetical protein PR003_g21760 [Phytophthora rubi]
MSATPLTPSAASGDLLQPLVSVQADAMPAPTVDAAPPSATRSQKKGKRTARKSPSKESRVLEWNPEMVVDLMRLRYATYSIRFVGTKNNARLREAWVLLADDLSRRHDRPISTEQCKNKLKWLRRKWAEYNSDMTATGNQSSPLIEPPGIELMQEYWSGSMGMSGDTLADNEGAGSSLNSDDDEASDEEAAGQDAAGSKPNSKRCKTMGDSFEIGMQSMTDSFQAMAAAFAPSSSDNMASLLDSRFAVMMERQEAQLAQMQMQTHYLAQLIETLQGRSPQ